ncbi:hypothetical protein [Bdellovibrio svalbardensis]|uniref:Uncharacterized protein n=1 Tax=Bdellovibrio svalbardensis TaxID=2972972 RepID=A0ABT6DED8_9BACT|nr:hypothetical protein [Bdellovibrio svalbardensis]MDG0815204.1 hypothetical protein [Bdellovibrio svalbardensis]
MLIAASLLIIVQGYFSSIIMIVMAALCFFAASLFLKERNLDPLRNFLRNPDDFEFVKGEIVSATYNANENRRNSRMLIEGVGKTLSGEPLLFFESFAPDIWPFLNEGENERLKPGDDQYDLKGKKRTLPVPIYVIYQKRSNLQSNSVGVAAALVGIDKDLIEPIESTLRRRRSWLPRGGKT